jgi:predicted O-methyltransferase YrrM
MYSYFFIMAKEIKLTKDLVDAYDLSSAEPFVAWSKNAHYFDLEAGKEHYRLLGFLAEKIGGDFVVDIGTYMGLSALALSTTGTKVITYDICDWIPEVDVVQKSVKTKENVEFRVANCLHDMEELVKADFIVLDVDPHDGCQEPVIMDRLEKHGFKGVLFLDDIHLNAEMHAFWNDIKQTKFDLSPYGHHSGSGVVVYDPSRFTFSLE